MTSDQEHSERRARIVQGIVDETGVDDAMIKTLVHTFYGKVRTDELIGPVFDRVHQEALKPYLAGQLSQDVALERATTPVKEFMLRQTRTRDLEYFLELGGYGPTAVKDLPMRVVIPAFVISELQTAFQMGFLLFLPFLVIDFLVSSVLMALGMMMMPPVTIALPLKLLLFVLVDGWHLVVKSIVQSFA